MPSPYRARLDRAVALNAACVSCHREEADAWSWSRHRGSFTNAAFQSAFTVEPTPFCRGCHAPEADPGATPERALAELGVGCVTCHVTGDDDVVLAGDRDRGASSDERSAPHRVRRSADLGGVGACAACHEFAFPGAPAGEDDAHLMQTTVREHRRSPAATEGCPTCHMPEVSAGGWRSHAFGEVRDPSWLADHLDAKAEVLGTHVRVTLAQRGGGHAFPTGDLFRRLEVGCELRARGGEVLGRRDLRYLARHFELSSGKSGRRLTLDDRVFDAPVVVELDLTSAASADGRLDGDVAWWVTYQRVADVGTGAEPRAATIESEVKLHDGVLRREANR